MRPSAVYISRARQCYNLTPYETVAELSLNVADQTRSGDRTFARVNRCGQSASTAEVRNSPDHRGIHLPRQRKILVRVPRAERVQSGPGGIAARPVLVYRQVPRRAGSC